MIILGIDPGAVRLGYGLIKVELTGFKLLGSGIISMPQEPDETFGEYRRRVALTHWDDWPHLARKHLGDDQYIDVYASETIPAKGSGNFINPQTEVVKAAITAMQIAQYYYTPAQEWREIASSTIRKAVFGMASKPPKVGSKKRIKVSKVDMRNAVQEVFPALKERVWEEDLLPDEIDGIAVALAAGGYKRGKHGS